MTSENAGGGRLATATGIFKRKKVHHVYTSSSLSPSNRQFHLIWRSIRVTMSSTAVSAPSVPPSAFAHRPVSTSPSSHNLPVTSILAHFQHLSTTQEGREKQTKVKGGAASYLQSYCTILRSIQPYILMTPDPRQAPCRAICKGNRMKSKQGAVTLTFSDVGGRRLLLLGIRGVASHHCSIFRCWLLELGEVVKGQSRVKH
ncbi:hypothetical protein BJ875DRAFT_148219 [Amylocarpus encephaloides]|uniref:Uncharacterized protein n=1 Tax=Amylocarpus encephaloides TaxID=45428 RepID=A0A9P8CA50_9HELO|nr:hypothetical protein BJ875DRAFT_148219 [Amylocarpus encephaloides]